MNAIVQAISERYEKAIESVRKGKVLYGDSVVTLASKYVYPVTKESLGIAVLGASDRQVGDIDEANYAITATLTTALEDRDSDYVDPMGCQLHEYERNPVIFFGHQSWDIPIGKAVSPDGRLCIYKDSNRIRGTCWFDQSDEDAMFLFAKIKNGFVNATSIAFVPLVAHRREYEEKAQPRQSPMMPPGWAFSSYSLTEWSWVGIPANPLATVERGSIKDYRGWYRDTLDQERKSMSLKLQKGWEPYCAVAKGCWNGWCPCPPCPDGQVCEPCNTIKNKQFVVKMQKGDVANRLAKIGEELRRHVNPSPMPGYGQIFTNDNDVDGHKAEVWYVGGDGDEDGFHRIVEDKIREAYPAVGKITIESESFPGDGWKQVYPVKKELRFPIKGQFAKAIRPHDFSADEIIRQIKQELKTYIERLWREMQPFKREMDQESVPMMRSMLAGITEGNRIDAIAKITKLVDYAKDEFGSYHLGNVDRLLRELKQLKNAKGWQDANKKYKIYVKIGTNWEFQSGSDSYSNAMTFARSLKAQGKEVKVVGDGNTWEIKSFKQKAMELTPDYIHTAQCPDYYAQLNKHSEKWDIHDWHTDDVVATEHDSKDAEHRMQELQQGRRGNKKEAKPMAKGKKDCGCKDCKDHKPCPCKDKSKAFQMEAKEVRSLLVKLTQALGRGIPGNLPNGARQIRLPKDMKPKIVEAACKLGFEVAFTDDMPGTDYLLVGVKQLRASKTKAHIPIKKSVNYDSIGSMLEDNDFARLTNYLGQYVFTGKLRPTEQEVRTAANKTSPRRSSGVRLDNPETHPNLPRNELPSTSKLGHSELELWSRKFVGSLGSITWQRAGFVSTFPKPGETWQQYLDRFKREEPGEEITPDLKRSLWDTYDHHSKQLRTSKTKSQKAATQADTEAAKPKPYRDLLANENDGTGGNAGRSQIQEGDSHGRGNKGKGKGKDKKALNSTSGAQGGYTLANADAFSGVSGQQNGKGKKKQEHEIDEDKVVTKRKPKKTNTKTKAKKPKDEVDKNVMDDASYAFAGEQTPEEEALEAKMGEQQPHTEYEEGNMADDPEHEGTGNTVDEEAVIKPGARHLALNIAHMRELDDFNEKDLPGHEPEYGESFSPHHEAIKKLHQDMADSFTERYPDHDLDKVMKSVAGPPPDNEDTDANLEGEEGMVNEGDTPDSDNEDQEGDEEEKNLDDEDLVHDVSDNEDVDVDDAGDTEDGNMGDEEDVESDDGESDESGNESTEEILERYRKPKSGSIVTVFSGQRMNVLGKVQKVANNGMATIKLRGGSIIKRHVSQMRVVKGAAGTAAGGAIGGAAGSAIGGAIGGAAGLVSPVPGSTLMGGATGAALGGATGAAAGAALGHHLSKSLHGVCHKAADHMDSLARAPDLPVHHHAGLIHHASEVRKALTNHGSEDSGTDELDDMGSEDMGSSMYDEGNPEETKGLEDHVAKLADKARKLMDKGLSLDEALQKLGLMNRTYADVKNAVRRNSKGLTKSSSSSQASSAVRGGLIGTAIAGPPGGLAGAVAGRYAAKDDHPTDEDEDAVDDVEKDMDEEEKCAGMTSKQQEEYWARRKALATKRFSDSYFKVTGERISNGTN